MAFSFRQRQSKHEGQEHVNTLLSMGEIVMIEGEGCPKKPITYCNKFRESQYCHLHVLKMTYDQVRIKGFTMRAKTQFLLSSG